MQFFNHYSAPILATLLLVGGLTLVLRRGGKMRQWLVFCGAIVGLGAGWWVFRPVATSVTPVAGLPLLLEVQSPYCLGCVVMKPLVDGLEYEFRGKLVLRRVDIQSAEGRRLASQYGVEMTPTFVFFDTAGNEQWRSAEATSTPPGSEPAFSHRRDFGAAPGDFLEPRDRKIEPDGG